MSRGGGEELKVGRNQYEKMGSDVTMLCGALDNSTSVTWKVNGTDVKAPHRVEGPRLLLTRVNSSHNGLYSCFQNPHGERRDSINLRIGRKCTTATRASPEVDNGVRNQHRIMFLECFIIQ
uniref:Ig-like domain-containing protein n=1 Tax=Knipowitschia caucasica TaxID=637954 RepID=A0AAV2IWT7_KNICA